MTEEKTEEKERMGVYEKLERKNLKNALDILVDCPNCNSKLTIVIEGTPRMITSPRVDESRPGFVWICDEDVEVRE